ncbi:hypothetical protein J2Y02_005019 [Neobacillus drentensis]|nr:hypothetical protein [Neobacillus drentensis]
MCRVRFYVEKRNRPMSEVHYHFKKRRISIDKTIVKTDSRYGFCPK